MSEKQIENLAKGRGSAAMSCYVPCFNEKCCNHDNSESGCRIHSLFATDLCPLLFSENAAARINELESALRKISGIQWGYDGDCGVNMIVDSVLDT